MTLLLSTILFLSLLAAAAYSRHRARRKARVEADAHRAFSVLNQILDGHFEAERALARNPGERPRLTVVRSDTPPPDQKQNQATAEADAVQAKEEA